MNDSRPSPSPFLHCAKCGAMQPNQARCGSCGAKLPGFVDPEKPPDPIDNQLAIDVALLALTILGGIVVLSILVILGVFWLLS